jgi:hypothetical protein
VAGEKLLDPRLVDANAHRRGFLLITDHLGQREGTGDEEQDGEPEEQSLPRVQRKKDDATESADGAAGSNSNRSQPVSPRRR